MSALHKTLKIVYTAQSKHFFYAKMFICQYVTERDAVPLNPFNIWSYFLNEMVDRNKVRCGNNNIVRISDEVWIFGPISDGVYNEILYAISLNKPLKFFTLGSSVDSIKPQKIDQLIFEEDISEKDKKILKEILENYQFINQAA